jgi:diaminopimelate epimerase
MNFTFFKYQGTGNDFILIDDRNALFPREEAAFIEKICHRRFGVGADGLILIAKCDAADFEMLYFNADGKIGSMCGNGGRCAVHFANFLKIFDKNTVFKAYDGIHTASIAGNIVSLSMRDVERTEKIGENYFLNTGSPHVVCFVNDAENYPVVSEGKKIRYADAFVPGGTNVNFAEKKSDEIFVRTYERGVEDETYSCGTGVTAVALAAFFADGREEVRINTRGGALKVRFNVENGTFRRVFLEGQAECVFEGKILYHKL